MPVEDDAEILLRFENGTLGSVHLDYNQRPACHWLEMIGTQGTLRWDNADGSVRLVQAGQDGKAVTQQDFPPPQGFERNSMFLEELRHFLDILHGEADPVCTFQDGVMALRLALSSLTSSQLNQIIIMKDHFTE